MAADEGGTSMYCPNCGEVQVCKALNPSELGEPSDQRLQYDGHPEIQWFRRGRQCLKCRETFMTAEVQEGIIFEFVKLRATLAGMKSNAKEYLEQLTAASEALRSLLASANQLLDHSPNRQPPARMTASEIYKWLTEDE